MIGKHYNQLMNYYKHSKNKVNVVKGDVITYKIRVYNEGNVAGTAQSIVQHLPNGVSLAPNSEIKNQYGWSTPANAQTAVTEYLEAAGLKGYSTHKLRHTAATLMYQNGVDVRALQEILGHEDISTTQIYTHIDKKELRDIYDNAFPEIKKGR